MRRLLYSKGIYNLEGKIKKIIIRFIYVFLPLTAFLLSGVSLYLWYGAIKPEAVKIQEFIPSRISPESFSLELEAKLLDVLLDLGIEKKDIDIKENEFSLNRIKKIYNVKVPENISLTILNLKINAISKGIGGLVFRGIESSDGNNFTIEVGTERTSTDVIILRKVKGIQAAKAKMAIIVDDIGIKSLNFALRLCNIKQELTLSILPFQRHTSEVVDLANETGTPYILHMPMEPLSINENPGEGAIYISDVESDIREKLAQAFKSVHGAQGLNNHMGSKATEDARTMEIIMKYFNENGYFFVDSQTSRNSKAYPLSQKLGVKSVKLDSYIDVEDNKAFISKRLDELAEAAFDKGLVIVICHDRLNTVEVLEQKLPELEERGIKFVKVADIVH